MVSQLNCPGGCKSITKKKFKRSQKINTDTLKVNCTNDNHEKPALFECNNCNLIFSELANCKFLDKYTDVQDEKYISQIIYKQSYFQKLYEKIKNEINLNGNVLEIGSYYGVFANIANKDIKNFSSIELSMHARDFAKKNYNIDSINQDPIKYLDNKKNFFDCILMFDVIEHLDDPFIFMQKLNSSLKKDGKFIFTTFDMDSLFPKIMGRNYHWIMPMHKYYFSEKTLSYYLNKNGLKIYKTKNDERDISIKYLFYKLSILLPMFKKIFINLGKINFLSKKNIKINFYDLKIFFACKK